jgi:decaprenylphospho-beta-D-erythro-pentofuranosid-2-ulose 2-reductase
VTRVLLLGGTSEIGLAIVSALAARGPVQATLLGRDRSGLETAAVGLGDRGCGKVEIGELDALAPSDHAPAIAAAFAGGGPFDIVVLAIGLLGTERGLDAEVDEAVEVMQVNFVGCGSLLLHSLKAMSGTGGTLVVLSSAAGERVRASNAVYGAAKAGLDGLAEGLGTPARAAGVRLLVVRPGFVATRMTAGLRRPPLSTTPEAVAAAVLAALGRSTTRIWVPRALRPVMSVLRHLPGPVFRRLPI